MYYSIVVVPLSERACALLPMIFVRFSCDFKFNHFYPSPPHSSKFAFFSSACKIQFQIASLMIQHFWETQAKSLRSRRVEGSGHFGTRKKSVCLRDWNTKRSKPKTAAQSPFFWSIVDFSIRGQLMKFYLIKHFKSVGKKNRKICEAWDRKNSG